MWIYEQSTGVTLHGDAFAATGYSGFDTHKNRPESQTLEGLGPIPQGAYSIGAESESDAHGPLALHLIPLPGTQTFGRSGFLVHGDSIEHPGLASHGCIILPRAVREAMARSPDRLLVVLSGNPIIQRKEVA